MANGSSCCQPLQRPPWPKRVASRVSNVRVGTGEMRSSIGGGEKIYDSFVKDHVVGLDRFGWCMQVVILLFYYKLILKLAQSFCFYTLKDLNPFFYCRSFAYSFCFRRVKSSCSSSSSCCCCCSLIPGLGRTKKDHSVRDLSEASRTSMRR